MNFVWKIALGIKAMYCTFSNALAFQKMQIKKRVLEEKHYRE